MWEATLLALVKFGRRGELAMYTMSNWLVLAETGYIGLVAFVAFLVPPLIAAFRCGFRHRTEPKGELLLGLGVALFGGLRPLVRGMDFCSP